MNIRLGNTTYDTSRANFDSIDKIATDYKQNNPRADRNLIERQLSAFLNAQPTDTLQLDRDVGFNVRKNKLVMVLGPQSYQAGLDAPVHADARQPSADGAGEVPEMDAALAHEFAFFDSRPSISRLATAREKKPTRTGTDFSRMDGIQVEVERRGVRMEADVYFMDGDTSFGTCTIHMSLQRHHWSSIDSAAAKPKNSLMAVDVPMSELHTDMEDIAEQYADFLKHPPRKKPRVLSVQARSGRHYNLDSLEHSQVHCFCTSGPGVTRVSHGQFCGLKAMKDLAAAGQGHYNKTANRASCRTIVTNDAGNPREFFRIAEHFGLPADLIAHVKADVGYVDPASRRAESRGRPLQQSQQSQFSGR